MIIAKTIYLLTFLGEPIMAFTNKDLADNEITERECQYNSDYELIPCFLQFPENKKTKKIKFEELGFED